MRQAGSYVRVALRQPASALLHLCKAQPASETGWVGCHRISITECSIVDLFGRTEQRRMAAAKQAGRRAGA